MWESSLLILQFYTSLMCEPTTGMAMKDAHTYARILQSCLWICVIVICAVYTGNLTASLAVQRISWPFTDLEGVADNSEYQILLQTGSISEELFQVSGILYRYYYILYKYGIVIIFHGLIVVLSFQYRHIYLYCTKCLTGVSVLSFCLICHSKICHDL